MKQQFLTATLVGAATLALAGCDQMLPLRREVVAAPPTADSASTTEAAASRPRRPAPPADSIPAVDEDHAFNSIRRGLRRLVAAQQGFYAENGAYTEDFDRLGFKPEGGAEFRFLWVTREGWAASGSHPVLPGRDCVIFVGRVNAAPTSLKYLRTAREGVPACDVTPPPPRRSDSDPVPVTRATDTASALEAVNAFVQMRVDLRNLIRSQDAYHATQGTYSRRMEPLALQYLWQRGVSVAILSADPYSWSARASHVAEPGKSCVIWVGPVRIKPITDSQRHTPQKSGIPACDE